MCNCCSWGNDKNCQYLLKMYGSEKYFPFSLIYLRRLNVHVRNLVTQYVNELLNERGTPEVRGSKTAVVEILFVFI